MTKCKLSVARIEYLNETKFPIDCEFHYNRKTGILSIRNIKTKVKGFSSRSISKDFSIVTAYRDYDGWW